MSFTSPLLREASPLPATCPSAFQGRCSTVGDAESSSDSDYEEPALNTEDGEQEEGAASGSETEDFYRDRRRRQRIHFDVKQLQTVYHLPLKTAAERLGICEAALKRICRRNHIYKWPYRQLSSVHRRIADLNDRRVFIVNENGGTDDIRLTSAHFVIRSYELPSVDRLQSPDRREQEHVTSVTPAQFEAKMQQLEEEQSRIIRLAHQPHQSLTRSSATDAPSQQRSSLNEELVGHLNGIRRTIADLPPLDISRIDRDFPLLFLANVCESVRAYHQPV